VTRVAVVGAGMVGATTAARLAEARLCDHVALIDVAGDLARAMALDIGSSLPLLGSDTTLSGGEGYDQARGADVVVITAGRPRQPGQSRADLLEGNGRIVAGVCSELRAAAPDAVVIVVTNPLDEMTTLAQDALGFPPERVVGMAGLLDTARFRHFLAERAGAPASTVEALTLGSHGDTMVPLSRTASIAGRPAGEVLGDAVLGEVVQRTRDGGAEVVRLLQRGSAYWAPSAAVLLMLRAILCDEQVVLPIAARLSGEFGIDGVYVGVPARLGRRGVSEIVTAGLDEAEVAALRAAADEVRGRVADLRALGLLRGVAAPAMARLPAVTSSGSLLDVVRETLL
jgi:malate dehydrogenase